MSTDLAEFHRWFEERRAAHAYRVTRVPLTKLDGWSADPGTGDLVHRSGRFFGVHGLDVRVPGRAVEEWRQPVISQPEHGILGILVRDFDGVPHCLLQAKMEPGNVNALQLSPTVQATRSNYTRVHRGRAVPYLDLFTTLGRGRPLADALQSEQGAWFLAKRNRNIVVRPVRTDEDVPVFDDFRWLSMDEIGRLLAVDDLVNMDTRTVLSHLAGGAGPAAARFRGRPLHSLPELLNWLTHHRTAEPTVRRRIPLRETTGWRMTDDEVGHEEGRYFRIIGVDVRAGSREVAAWSQPLLAPCGQGVVAFLVRDIGGTPHVLVRARAEAGTPDTAEIGPTVQCVPANYAHLPEDRRPRYLDTVLAAASGARPGSVLFDVVQSEEGGRFHHARNRYLAVRAGDDVPLEEDDAFRWATCGQLAALNQYGGFLNVEARTLLACMGFIP
ncbi:NDP-hexose 2,3-dehydratase family protein [Streptomyces sp. TYQ1024]|uniref:NDP-hexose 2,3-dehydratase family protein n=1 Tax=Streptomyces sp. TYQ1024 TaxID=2762559 RepID=UPI00163CE5F1|nr:NDP-hexose 2,3-dehydratase family protein [Streptomyces sp. TYQ1024]MBC2876182.1 NDP-hexose 2,3-dehydratase family protein [Streptomyces sp. TYQ1024]UKW28185.1 NDP-hexose 2,3-dehydratase family protein [Streptomyces sp. TYQ1024]